VFPEEIATERLRLRRLCRENVGVTRLYRHMRADAPGMAEVSEYVMWDPHETPRDTREYLRTVERQWDDREQATYAVFPRERETDGGAVADANATAPDATDSDATASDATASDATAPDANDSDATAPDAPELAGTTNLHVDWDRRSAELGIWLRKPFWGRGYSGERAAALLEVAFDRLDLDVVGSSHQDGNHRSRRAIEKYVAAFGGQYDGRLRDFAPTDGEVRDLHRYTVTREQYREALADDREITVR